MTQNTSTTQTEQVSARSLCSPFPGMDTPWTEEERARVGCALFHALQRSTKEAVKTDTCG